MEVMKGNLYSEETKRKAFDTENGQALILESKGRSKNRVEKGHDKSKGRSQIRDKIKCFYWGKDGAYVKELSYNFESKIRKKKKKGR